MAVASLTIAFEGPQFIASVEAARDRLSAALASGQPLDIDLAAVTEADLAFVQLLISVRKSAVASNRDLRWRGIANPAIDNVLVRGGLTGAGLFEDVAAEGVSQ